MWKCCQDTCIYIKKCAPSKKGLNIYIVGAKSIRKGMGVEYIAEIPRVYQT